MKKFILLVCAGFLAHTSYSQISLINFLKGGKDDANKLVKAYMDPYASALGDGLNNGWYNSADTHSLFGFDLSLSVSAIQVPSEAQTFDLSTIGLTKLSLVNPSNHIAPTVAGKDIPGPELQIKDEQGNTITTFNSPNGYGLDVVPVPIAQIGFGLLPHTDLIFRYVPEMKYQNSGDDMKIGFWGVGAKHNFKEWIPVLKALPFDASVFASYSEMNAHSNLSFNPFDYNTGNVTVTLVNNYQMLKMKTNTSKIGLVVSKKLGMLTVFGGIGQSKSETNIDLIGKYIIDTKINAGGEDITITDNMTDPIAIQVESKNISLDAGLRLKLAFFSLFGSVNKAEYTSYNAGVSFGFR